MPFSMGSAFPQEVAVDMQSLKDRLQRGALPLNIKDSPEENQWNPLLRQILETRNATEFQIRSAAATLAQQRLGSDLPLLRAEFERGIAASRKDMNAYPLGDLLSFIAFAGGEKEAPLISLGIARIVFTSDDLRAHEVAVALLRLMDLAPADALQLARSMAVEVPRRQLEQEQRDAERPVRHNAKSEENAARREFSASGASYGKLLFAASLVRECVVGRPRPKSIQEALLDLVQNHDSYWVRVYARNLVVQMIDMEKSGFTNWIDQPAYRRYSIVPRLVDYAHFGPDQACLWFPCKGDNELSRILDVYKAKLGQIGWPSLFARNTIVMSNGKQPPPQPLVGQELEDELNAARHVLQERNARWAEFSKRIAFKQVTKEEFLKTAYLILDPRCFGDLRLIEPTFGGDF